jgi:hypothetical protein
MADGTATFRLALDASGAAAGADQAADAVEGLKDELLGSMAEMRNMQSALRNMKAGGLANTEAYTKLGDRLASQKVKVGSLQASYVELGGSFAKAKPKIKDTGAALEKVKAGAAGAAPPAQSLAAQFRALRTSGHPLVTVAVAVSAALLAIAAAAVTAGAALASYGLAQANARRNELIRLEGLTKMRRFGMFGAMGRARGPGDPVEMQKTIDRVSASVALGRGQLEGYTRQLHRMGLRGGNLTNTLEAMAFAASAGDEKQAQLYKQMALMAGLTGSSMKKVADDAKARFGGVVARQMLSLDVQGKKLQESFAMLFSGINLEPLLKGLQQITKLFGQQTATGRALKQLIEVMFQPLIDTASGNTGLLLKRMIQGAVIAMQKLIIVALTAYLVIKDKLAAPGLLKNLDLELTAAIAGAVILATTLGFVASALTLIVGLGALVAAPFVLAGAAIVGLTLLAGRLIDKLTGGQWAEAGTAIVTGLVNSLLAGTGPIGDAMRELGKAGVNAFKDALGIKSPSRVMFKAGLNVTGGLSNALGIGRRQVDRAMRRLVVPPTAAETGRASRALAAPAAVAAGAGGGSVTLNIAPGAVVISGADTGEDFGQMVQRALEDLAERILIQMGGR